MDTDDRGDVTPVSVGDLAAAAIPVKFLQQDVLGRVYVEITPVAEIDTQAASKLAGIQGSAARHVLERTRLGRRVLCTDRHSWSTGRIIHAFRGQWNVEELFRRAKKGGVVPWGPSHQWVDSSLRLHTFATVIGLTLVSLARIALGTRTSARHMIKTLAEVKATLVRVRTQAPGRQATVMLAPDLSGDQRKAVRTFDLARWMPILLSSMGAAVASPDTRPVA